MRLGKQCCSLLVRLCSNLAIGAVTGAREYPSGDAL